MFCLLDPHLLLRSVCSSCLGQLRLPNVPLHKLTLGSLLPEVRGCAYMQKAGDCGDISPQFFLDFPQNFRLRTRNQYCTQAIAWGSTILDGGSTILDGGSTILDGSSTFFLLIFTIFYRFSRFTHFCRDLHFDKSQRGRIAQESNITISPWTRVGTCKKLSLKFRQGYQSRRPFLPFHLDFWQEALEAWKSEKLKGPMGQLSVQAN